MNPQGAVYRLYGKIDRGEFPLQDMMVMKNCSACCDQLLAVVRRFWRLAPYLSEDCKDNEWIAFNNAPSNIELLQLALRAVQAIDERPPKKVCSLCHRNKSKSSLSNDVFEAHAIKCNQCMATDKELEKKEGMASNTNGRS